jgi:hypothetical protein
MADSYKHHPIIAKKYYRQHGGFRWMIVEWDNTEEGARNKLKNFIIPVFKAGYPKAEYTIAEYQEQGKGPVRYHVLMRTKGVRPK